MIDPYGLLGCTVASSPAEVRRAYRDLALIVHPDKGGSAADMQTLHDAYRYVHVQVSAADLADSVEGRETSFEEFCKSQSEEPPRYRDIFEDDEERRAFFAVQIDEPTRAWGEGILVEQRGREARDGYGASMAASEYAGLPRDACPVYVDTLSPTPPLPSPGGGGGGEGGGGGGGGGGGWVPFASQVVVYTEPQGAGSTLFDGLGLAPAATDYALAYNTTPEPLAPQPSDRSLEALLQERCAFEAVLAEAPLPESPFAKYDGRTQRVGAPPKACARPTCTWT